MKGNIWVLSAFVIFGYVSVYCQIEDSIQGHYLYNLALNTENLDSLYIYLSQARPFFDQIGDDENAIQCDNGCYFALLNLDRFSRLAPIAHLAYEEAIQKLDVHSPARFSATNNLGTYYKETSNYFLASRYYEEAKELHRKGNKISDDELLILFDNLGVIYSMLGDYDRALDHWDYALELIDKGNLGIKEYYRWNTIYNKARAKRFLGDTIEAAKLFSLIVDNVNTESSNGHKELFVESEINLAEFAVMKGELPLAEKHLNKAIETQKQLNDYRIDRTFRLLSELALAKNDMQGALSWSIRSVHKTEERFETRKDPRLAQAYGLHAKNLVRAGQDKAAKYMFTKSVQALSYQEHIISNVWDFNADSIISAIDLISTVKDYLTYYNVPFEQTKTFLFDIDILLDRAIGSISRTESKLIRVGDLKKYVDFFINYLLTKYEQSGEKTYLNLAFYFSIKNKNKLLYADIIGHTKNKREGHNVSLFSDEYRLKREIEFFKHNKAKQKEDSIQQIIFQLSEELESVRKQLNDAFPGLEFDQNIRKENVDQFVVHLDRHSKTLINFFYGEKYIYGFCVNGDTLTYHRASLTKILKRQLRRLASVVSDASQNSVEEYCALSNQIFTSLYKPLLQTVSPSKGIVVSLDGLLNRIPLEALAMTPCGSDVSSFLQLDYALDRYDISYMTGVYNNKKERKKRRKALGAFAPTYKRTSTHDLVPLEQNTKEIESIREYFHVDIFSGNQATKDIFLMEANQYKWLHIASHAITDTEKPENSRIVFSNNESLYPYELYDIGLDADMVVLSACEAGTGRYHNGEGVFSLARNFLSLGVQTVLTSLWQADDASTSQLMKDYYQGLRLGLDKAAALSFAKHQFLEQADAISSHPYYWSGFMLIGDTSAVTDVKDKRRLIFIVVLLLSLLAWLGFHCCRQRLN